MIFFSPTSAAAMASKAWTPTGTTASTWLGPRGFHLPPWLAALSTLTSVAWVHCLSPWDQGLTPSSAVSLRNNNVSNFLHKKIHEKREWSWMEASVKEFIIVHSHSHWCKIWLVHGVHGLWDLGLALSFSLWACWKRYWSNNLIDERKK